jgi:transposase
VDLDAVLATLFDLIAPHLNERQRRLLLGAGARALGRGGGARMARLSGMSRPTVYAGVRELDEPPDPHGRIRRPGGGPKRLRDTDPDLVEALDRLVDPDTRGDPCSPLRWTTKSTRELAEALTTQGHPVSDDTVGRLLKEQGYRWQRTTKTPGGRPAPRPGRQVPLPLPLPQRAGPRAPGRLPASGERGHQEEGAGRRLRQRRGRMAASGESVEVNVHDFPDPALGKAIPHGSTTWDAMPAG